MKQVLPVALALVAITVAACNNSSNSSTTSPTPASPSKSETFTGTVQPLAGDFHNFIVGQSGEVDITLNSTAPVAAIQMGIGIGTPSTTTCPHNFGEARNVAAGPNIAGSVILNAGTYCLDVFDYGNAGQPITYTVTVAHP